MADGEDHARLIRVAANWERLYNERGMALDIVNTQLEYAEDAIRGLAGVNEENARLRALVSWIDGQLVDEAPHLVIREAINRWREDVNTHG